MAGGGLTLLQGDLLRADVEALVNAVNCVGVMGRGLAAQFKDAFPENFHAYAEACRRLPKTIRSRSTIQIGMLPTRSAATPAGTVCCAQARLPWPTTNSSPPKTSAAPT